jgi:flagellar P-ring protein FlgI
MIRQWNFQGLMALALVFFSMTAGAASDTVRIKDIGRFGGWRDNMLVGYGVATGLAGTGDSRDMALRLA